MTKLHCLLVALLMTSIPVSGQDTFPELVDLFGEWREFETPEMKDGVPDYSVKAMDLQKASLPFWRERLAQIDTTSWSISNQVDWYLVWAEMNGLELYQQALKPWSRDPGFYVWFYPDLTDVPERESPNIEGNIQWAYFEQPLSDTDAKSIAKRLGSAEALYKQAKENLNLRSGTDLWRGGIRNIKGQSKTLARLADEYATSRPNLSEAMKKAKDASDDFLAWLESSLPKVRGKSNLGPSIYTMNLQRVHLLPYTWQDEKMLMERELARAHSSLRLEQHRNNSIDRLEKITDPQEYSRRFKEAVDEYLSFLKDEEVLPMKDYMRGALEARINSFVEFEGIRGFFSEISYRDLLPMRTHDYHWIDLARMGEEPHPSPIRQQASLYNIFDGRAEGMATGMEEMMMHAGLFDDKPKARELIWILLAQRCARGLAALHLHQGGMNIDQAAEFASSWTPWGLLPADGNTIRGEEHFYLRQPGYGTSYVIGKIEIEKLIAEYARQRNGEFVLSEFMDKFNKSGMIPVSLIYWEMTGDKSMLNRALGRK